MSEIFLLLESDPIGTGTLFFKRAREIGLRPILLSTEPEVFPALTEFENIKLSEITERSVLDIIDRLGREHVRGVWSVRDRLAELAARVSMAIGRPCADPGPIAACSDKYKTRQTLADAGVKDVEFALVRSAEEAEAAASVFGGRVVLKPRSSCGSLGVRLCRDAEEALGHFKLLAKQLPEVRDKGALIEAVVDGRQFSVQIFDGRSIGVTRQDVGPPPSFITTGLDFPWVADAKVHGEIVAHAERAVAAVGHCRGPGSIDVRYGVDGPCIIEINPRLGGDMISENVRLATGVDVVEATIRFACGMPYDLVPRRHRASATRWLLRPNAPVRDVLGREEAVSVPGVVNIGLLPHYFGREGPVIDSQDRLAYVIAEADTAAKAGEIAELSLRKLRAEPIKLKEKLRRAGRRLIGTIVRRVPGAANLRAILKGQSVFRRRVMSHL